MSNIDTHLEIERRYLIDYPNEADLLAFAGAYKTEIAQTYLTAPVGVSRRVRKRVGAQTVYTYTEKRKKSTAVREETEYEISESEYLALLKEADPACAPVCKVRICVPFNGFVWEADLFPFWEHVAVLEVELSDLSELPQVPPCFCILKEITADPSMTNHNLARHIQAKKTAQLLASVL